MSNALLQVFSVTDAQYQALLPTLREVARAEETRRLARALALSQGFSFHLATCETPMAAQALILCLAREVPELSGTPTPMVMVTPTRETDAALLPRRLTEEVFEGLLGGERRATPQVTFLDATDSRSDDLDAWLWLFQRLNERRNHLYASGHPLVFLLPPALTVELMRFAPDLWSIRSASVRLRGGGYEHEAGPATLHLEEGRWPVDGDLPAQRMKVEQLLSSSGPHGLRALMVEFRRLAEMLHARGETDQAMQLLREEIQPRIDRAHPHELKSGLMGDIIETLVRLEQAEEAEQIARQHVLPHLEARGDRLTKVMVLTRLADGFRFCGDHSRALHLLLDEAMPLAERIADNEAKAEVLNRAVLSYLRLGQLQRAQDILNEHGALLEEWLTPLEYAFMNLQLAELQRESGSPDASLDTLKQRVLPNAKSDARLQALAWHFIARAHRYRGDLQEAIQILRAETLPIYRRLHNIRGRAMANMAIAAMLRKLGREEEALRLLREEVDALRGSAARSPKDAMDRLNVITTLVGELHDAGVPEEAEELLRQELQSTTLGANAKMLLREQLVQLESCDSRGLQGGPERRHTFAGPEVYGEPLQ